MAHRGPRPRPPFISVITVVRDDAEGLRRTRSSLLAQSFRGFEWLVADGGSGPAVAALLSAWRGETAWQDSRPDGGPFAGMNRAMDHARGDWLLFLNAGDTLHAGDSLDRFARAAAAAPDAGLIYGDTVEDPGTGTPAVRRARHPRWAFYGMFAHHCAILYRRSVIGDLRYRTDLRVAADYALTLEVLRRASHTVRISAPVAGFAPGGLSRREEYLGRIEQRRVRQMTGCMPLAVDMGVALFQSASAKLRRFFPKCYAKVRFTSTLNP